MRGFGATKAQAFAQAARALVAVQGEPGSATPEPVDIRCSAPDDALLPIDRPSTGRPGAAPVRCRAPHLPSRGPRRWPEPPSPSGGEAQPGPLSVPARHRRGGGWCLARG
ncbi:MAG: hypothetical protein ACOC3D_05160, partial [Pseudomonadota bacterium]